MADQLDDVSDEVTVADSIKDAMKEIENREPVLESKEVDVKQVNTPVLKEMVSTEKEVILEKPEIVQKQAKPFPDAYNKHEAIKSKWPELSPEIQDALLAREQDIQKGLSRFDEDKNLGKQLREVINPYMPIIQAEGGNATLAVQSLLNSAYVLRTGDPVTKATLVHNLIKQYGIDMSIVQDSSGNQKQVDPAYKAVLDELNFIKQQVHQNNTLQDTYTNDKISSEYKAFSENPTNTHIELVKDDMVRLLEKGLAANFQEAYDNAIWLNPQSRSMLEQERVAKHLGDVEAKRKIEVEAKRKASVSINGSPGLLKTNTPESMSQNNTVEDDIRAALREVRDSSY